MHWVKAAVPAPRAGPAASGRLGRIVAVCRLGAEDLNAWLVARGWALAYRRYSSDYVDEEAAASAARHGIWRGDLVPHGTGAAVNGSKASPPRAPWTPATVPPVAASKETSTETAPASTTSPGGTTTNAHESTPQRERDGSAVNPWPVPQDGEERKVDDLAALPSICPRVRPPAQPLRDPTEASLVSSPRPTSNRDRHLRSPGSQPTLPPLLRR